jgi:hypothetical protein
MNFSRSMILVVGTALLAACGDKVTVTQYTPPATVAKVYSVDVAPATATVNTGASLTFTAAVNADAGVATTVTWSASAGSITTAGVFTAPTTASAGIAVCATSTVDTGKKGCATVVVSAPIATIPATVSIASITFGNLNAPVNPAAVAGQIDIKLNVNPGNQTVSKIVLVVGGVRADSQTFTAAQAAALRYAGDEAVAAQTTFPQILFSINTAKFSATTGVPTWLNVAQGVSAQLYTTQGGSTSAATATAQTTLTFANVDGYVATVATSGTTANALSATGFRYDRGGLDVTITPVIYSGRAIASATLLFGGTAPVCDASATGQRNTALTAPASGSTAWTKTGWAQTTPTGGAAANYLTNYEFSSAACPLANPVGETVLVTAVDANGDAILSAVAPLNTAAANSLRLDNRAPNGGNPTFIANPNGRQNSWINGAVSLVGIRTAFSATSNSWLLNAAQTDAGQGSYVPYLRVAASATGTVDEARAATASAAPTLPVASLANTTYCAIATAQDALGNETTRPGAGTACGPVVVASGTSTALSSQLFGVDIAAPTIALLNSSDDASALDANGRRGALGTVTNYFAVNVADTGTVGNSGMLTGSSVMGTVTIRNDAASPALTHTTVAAAGDYCAVGTYGTGTTCLAASVQAAPAFPKVVTGAGVTGNATPGYYTYTAYARDAAGNQSGTVTRVVAFDVAGNVPALTTALFNTPLSGGSVTFNANASDNFDLRDVTYALTYAPLAGPIVYPAVSLGTFNATQMYSNVAAGITIPNFIRQVEAVTAQAAGTTPVLLAGTGVTLGAAAKPTLLNGVARDQSNQSSVVAGTIITGAQVTTGVSYGAALAPQLVRFFGITNAATNISDGTSALAAVNPLSVTLNADAYGPTATFNQPFVRVDFYVQDALGNLMQIGTSTSVSTVDDGSTYGRRHRFSITWTPGDMTQYTNVAGVVNLYAIGVNSVGDALVTPISNNITLTIP